MLVTTRHVEALRRLTLSAIRAPGRS